MRINRDKARVVVQWHIEASRVVHLWYQAAVREGRIRTEYVRTGAGLCRRADDA